MKKITIFVFILIAILFCSVPALGVKNYVIDNANLLTNSIENRINNEINNFKSTHNADIVIVTTTTLDGKTPRAYADDFYDFNGYDKNGVLLLISLEDRNIYISTSGSGINAFTDYGINKALDEIAFYLSESNYESGINQFIKTANEYFTLAENGTPFDKDFEQIDSKEIIFIFIIIWVVSFIIALIIVSNMKSKLISIRSKSNANDYIQNEDIDLINSKDIFLYRNITRTRIPQNDGGSSIHRGSSGRTHGGGGRRF